VGGKGSGGRRTTSRPDAKLPGRPRSSYVSHNGHVGVKVDTATRTRLELLSVARQTTPDALVARLVEEASADYMADILPGLSQEEAERMSEDQYDDWFSLNRDKLGL